MESPAISVLTRQNVWRHNALHSCQPGLRCAALVEASSSTSWAVLARVAQEPEAEQQTRNLWACQFCPSFPDNLSLPESSSGDIVPERERLGVYLSLTPEQKAALSGADASITEATHMFAALPCFAASASQGSRSLRKRVRELELAFAALRERTDDLEQTTGVILGPGSRDNHAARLRRLEALHEAS